ADEWLRDYNEFRPHESLGGVPPVQYLPRLTLASNVYNKLST
ncbi:MAG: integrase core domain-containing protein, partial [Bordetella sp.]